MRDAVDAALAEVETTPADVAVIALARSYADTIDANPKALEAFGPKFLATLDALRLTPKARSAVMKGGNSDEQSPADELRARRSARKHGTPSSDATTP